jgi:hypothetical protein
MGNPDTWGARCRKCWKAGNLEKAFSPEWARSDTLGEILRNRAKTCERRLPAVYQHAGSTSAEEDPGAEDKTNGKRGSRNPIAAIRGGGGNSERSGNCKGG